MMFLIEKHLEKKLYKTGILVNRNTYWNISLNKIKQKIQKYVFFIHDSSYQINIYCSRGKSGLSILQIMTLKLVFMMKKFMLMITPVVFMVYRLVAIFWFICIKCNIWSLSLSDFKSYWMYHITCIIFMFSSRRCWKLSV